jgi:hypothetical protein
MRFYTASNQTVRKLEFSLKTGSFEAALPDRRVCDRSKWAKIPQKSGMACHSAEFSHSLDPDCVKTRTSGRQSGNGGRFSAFLVHRTLADAQKFDCGEPFFDIL